MSERKDEIISKVYFDRSGFGSISKTYQDANEKDNTITLDNVKNCFFVEMLRIKENLQVIIHISMMHHIKSTK